MSAGRGASAAASTTQGRRPPHPTPKGTSLIEARKVKLWDRRYDILEDGRTVAIWECLLWGTGGTVQLDGRRFQVKTNVLGGESSMAEGAGRPVAVAHGVGRKHWTIESDGETYHFLSLLALVLSRWESDSAATG